MARTEETVEMPYFRQAMMFADYPDGGYLQSYQIMFGHPEWEPRDCVQTRITVSVHKPSRAHEHTVTVIFEGEEMAGVADALDRLEERMYGNDRSSRKAHSRHGGD